jgi:UDP:flavonoid glycosyltransferase YjiC (YdhE family)
MGLNQPQRLLEPVQEWIELLQQIRPSLAFAELSLTLQIATRRLDIPTIQLGTGWSVPPRESPMPSQQPWFPISTAQLEALDRQATQAINHINAQIGVPLVDYLAQIWQPSLPALFTWPELDHYNDRAGHLGPILQSAGSPPPPWPRNSKKRCFIYLEPQHPHFHNLLKAIQDLGWSALLFAPGSEIAPSENLIVVSQPIDLHHLAPQCQLAITHGGHNTAALMLHHGVPLMILPKFLEQALLGYRLEQRGLAVSLNFMNPNPDILTGLQRAVALKPKPLPAAPPLTECLSDLIRQTEI